MFKEYNIQKIYTLPMCNKKQKSFGFENIEEVRFYLDEELPFTEKGKYYYNERGINLYDTDALILFQYGGKILGYGIFKDRNCDDKYYQFYPKSIYNIDEISAEEFRSAYPSLRKFTRMKIIPLDYLKQISLLLKRKRKTYLELKH